MPKAALVYGYENPKSLSELLKTSASRAAKETQGFISLCPDDPKTFSHWANLVIVSPQGERINTEAESRKSESSLHSVRRVCVRNILKLERNLYTQLIP